MEIGSTATDFESRSYGEELALCQRYFERIIVNSASVFLISCNRTDSDFRAEWDFTIPTAALGSGSSWGTGTPTITASISNVQLNRNGLFNGAGTAGNNGLEASAEL
jgi:hypothetical protein